MELFVSVYYLFFKFEFNIRPNLSHLKLWIELNSFKGLSLMWFQLIAIKASSIQDSKNLCFSKKNV